MSPRKPRPAGSPPFPMGRRAEVQPAAVLSSQQLPYGVRIRYRDDTGAEHEASAHLPGTGHDGRTIPAAGFCRSCKRLDCAGVAAAKRALADQFPSLAKET